MSASPFSYSRYEHEKEPLYYLPIPLFEKLERVKPSIIVGSRGTGKTTLLKALYWEERVNNNNLKETLNGKVFSNCFFGLYIKMSETDVDIIDSWLEEFDEPMRIYITSLYFDLISIEAAVKCLSNVLAKGIFHAPVKDELLVRLLHSGRA